MELSGRPYAAAAAMERLAHLSDVELERHLEIGGGAWATATEDTLHGRAVQVEGIRLTLG